MARSPNLIQLPVGSLTMAVWDWPGAEPPLVFAHGTSFHGRCWDSVILEFPGRRAVALEARGHGRSSKPDPPYHWSGFRRDLASILEQMRVAGAIGIGHSLGGHTMAAVAAQWPGAFSALLLVDPTIRPPEAYDTPPADVSFVRKRRAQWFSPQEMFESLRGRPPFDRWNPDVLRDYCDFGLLPEGRHFGLACPPNIEASIYECSKEPETRLQPALASVSAPVTVLRAGYAGDLPFSRSPTDPQLAAYFPNSRDVLLAERTHLIPMEAPEVVADQIRSLL